MFFVDVDGVLVFVFCVVDVLIVFDDFVLFVDDGVVFVKFIRLVFVCIDFVVFKYFLEMLLSEDDDVNVVEWFCVVGVYVEVFRMIGYGGDGEIGF